MDEYIKRNAAMREIAHASTLALAYLQVAGLKAADVAPVVHGRWILHDNGNGTCSVCHCISVHVWDFDSSLSFCPHCGAKMDGECNGD